MLSSPSLNFTCEELAIAIDSFAFFQHKGIAKIPTFLPKASYLQALLKCLIPQDVIVLLLKTEMTQCNKPKIPYRK